MTLSRRATTSAVLGASVLLLTDRLLLDTDDPVVELRALVARGLAALVGFLADRPPAHSGWHARLPPPWYVEAMNASTDSTTNWSAVLAERPPVIVTDSDSKGELTLWTSEYVVVEHDTSQLGKDTVFLIRADRPPADPPLVADHPTTARTDTGLARPVVSRR